MSEPVTLHLVIPFKTEKEAEIAYNSLRVDPEPKRSQVDKKVSFEGNKLIADFSATEARQVRLSSNTFIDHVILVQKTIANFSLDQ